ncbi:hypothetical protein FPSE_03391 [Fusarium pseudograminearum CS3096]|uniref:C2H2-type domain-containing protein n=1 Tax=Fusarium pseudograminearum (strain CS3096) TaxID=1028729 RepID=K3VMU0_FUSPC|nr:hypothetical protein FPSE_03391 [Fusarium pseudograminearum CS3096]EKJ76392.1 hypothetical protein FPSE_03391 [Fusarium pseudograminearum CS3096]
MEYNHKLESIASHVAKTFESFQDLENALAKTTSSDEPSQGATLKSLLTTVENDFTRFKMWAGNQAAHQSGPSCLDYRLREAPHLQQQVLYLLKDICESLQDASLKVSEIPNSLGQVQEKKRDENSPDNVASDTDWARDEDSDFSDSDFAGDLDESTTAFPTLVLDIGEAIDCLLRLSVAIANPAPHERFQKLGGGSSEDVSFFEPHDIAYVRDKFPKITDELANALGKFITRRRQFFTYRHAHHEKSASATTISVSNKETGSFHTESLAKFNPQAAVIDEDIRSDTGASHTSYATSAGFNFEGTEQEMRRPTPALSVPPQPSAAEDGIFKCPFCYKMVSAKTRTAWNHLEQLALFALPSLEVESSERQASSKEQHSAKSGTEANSLRQRQTPGDFICDICGKIFEKSYNLKGHIENHFEHRTFSCSICGDKFAELKDCRRHEKVHLESPVLFGNPTNLSPIIAQQQRPSPDLPAGGKNIKEEDGFDGFYGFHDFDDSDDSDGFDGGNKNPHGLSEKSLGKRPAPQDLFEGTKKKTGSPTMMHDVQQGRIMNLESEEGDFLDTASWSKGDIPSLETTEDSVRRHKMLSGHESSTGTDDVIRPPLSSHNPLLKESGNLKLLDRPPWSEETTKQNLPQGLTENRAKAEEYMDMTNKAGPSLFICSRCGKSFAPRTSCPG